MTQTNEYFTSDAFSGGQFVNPGTTSVFLNMECSNKVIQLIESYGSGTSWTNLNSSPTTTTANSPGAVTLLEFDIPTNGHTFAAGEKLNLTVIQNLGAMPNGLYWDGSYNTARIQTP